jgi:hypothetical protein
MEFSLLPEPAPRSYHDFVEFTQVFWFFEGMSMKRRSSYKANAFPFKAEQLRMFRYDQSTSPHRHT